MYVHNYIHVHVYMCTNRILLASESTEGGLTCYGESCASSLVATEGSCYNDGKFKI